MGKIVTAYSEGQCEINAGHSWKPNNEIFWHKTNDGKVITCNNKACFQNQGGKSKGEIKVKQEEASKPKTIEKHTGQTTSQNIQQNDRDYQVDDESITEPMFLEYVNYAKEIKIIKNAIREIFPEARGEEIIMITKLLWDVKHKLVVKDGQ